MERHAQAGFTLIEILVALVIFAIATLGVAAMQTSSIRGNLQARVIGEEVHQATSRVEALRLLPYTASELSDGTHTDGDASWVVTTQNLDAGDEYKTVDLTQTRQLGGETKTYSIRFIKSPQ